VCSALLIIACRLFAASDGQETDSVLAGQDQSQTWHEYPHVSHAVRRLRIVIDGAPNRCVPPNNQHHPLLQTPRFAIASAL
jgi:hypothetical protein